MLTKIRYGNTNTVLLQGDLVSELMRDRSNPDDIITLSEA